MFGPDLRAWVLGLDATQAVLFIRLLLLAESSRLRDPAGSVNVPGDIYSGDGGVDGQTSLGPNAAPPFLVGAWSWQIKATEAFRVAEELAKDGVKKDVAEGRDYVIVCTKELTGRKRSTRTKVIVDGVKALDATRTGAILTIEDVERMARVHPTVPALMGGPHPLGMTLDFWASELEVDRFPYQEEATRQRQVEQIRSFALGDRDAFHLHVFGDSGVGKSRAVYEALKQDGLHERVAGHVQYTEGARRALYLAASTDETNAIVVVDEVEPTEAEQLHRAAAAAEGRIRLITVGDRGSREMSADATSVEIVPLAEGAVQALAQRVGGISSEDAGYVANLSEGYPKLAVLLAEAIRDTKTRGPLIDLIRGRRIGELLEEMLPDEEARRVLAHLALVNRLGYDGELEVEARQLCETFGLPYRAFRVRVDRETGRFVAAAGRYRRVSPQAFAVWLAQRLIEADPDDFIAKLGQLPDTLFSSFRLQLQELGGNATFDGVMTEVVVRRTATFRGVSDVTPADAQLLNAVSFASPDLGADQIHALVVSSSPVELAGFSDERRRSFVWALQHLLWFSSTYERAASSLLALAAHENESWANNASGILAGSFQMRLGGTEMPLATRFGWLRTHAADFGDKSLRVAVGAVVASLSMNETRMGGWRGARLQPAEWRPASAGEVLELYQQGLDLLTTWANAYGQLRPDIAKALARALWTLVRSRSTAAYVAAVRSVDWDSEERSELLTAVRRELSMNEALGPEDRSSLGSLAESLEGDAGHSRLETLLATEVWELNPGRREPGPPPVLEELAQELVVLGAEEVGRQIPTLPSRKASTTFALFRIFGQKYPVMQSLRDDAGLPPEARVGYVSGLGERDFDAARRLIEEWRSDAQAVGLVPWAVSVLPPSQDLVMAAIDVVASGRVPLAELNRLRYGRWAAELSATAVVPLISVYLNGELGGFELEAAVGMLEAWLEAHPDAIEEDLLDLGARLFAAAAASDARGMLTYERNRMADRLKLPVRTRLPPTLEGLEASGIPESEDVAAISRMAHEDPEFVIDGVVNLVTAPDVRRMLLEDSHLLSVVARATSDDRVAERLLGLSDEGQERALRHIDFTTPELDPLAVRLLERRGTDDAFVKEVVVRFVFPGEVVMGPYSRRLEERLVQARRMQADHPSATVRRWAGEAIAALEEMIPAEVLREAEWG